jgi:biotin carboxyl carrier protein
MPKEVPVTVPMVGKIVKVLANLGDAVKLEDEVATFEAMKMEMPIVAPAAGKVKKVNITPGQLVEADSVIMVIETE